MEVALALIALLFSVVIHEVAHGWVALKQGDDTALRHGRLTLNPIPHIDPIGSIVVPLVLWFSPGGFLFGWAKPVPVDPRNFREYRKGDILVSLAGVTANLLLTVGFALLIVVVVHAERLAPGIGAVAAPLERMAAFGIFINLILAIFNLIPIPPLDGSHVVYHALPEKLRGRYRDLGRFGILIILAILFFVPGFMSAFLWPVVALQGLVESVIQLLI